MYLPILLYMYAVYSLYLLVVLVFKFNTLSFVTLSATHDY